MRGTLRHALVRQRPLHRRVFALVGAAARRSGPLHDDVVEHRVEETGLAEGIGPIRGRVRFYSIYAVVVIAVFTALTAAMTYPQVRYLNNAVTFDDGDPLFSTWRLAWVAHQLPRDPLRLRGHGREALVAHVGRGLLEPGFGLLEERDRGRARSRRPRLH